MRENQGIVYILDDDELVLETLKQCFTDNGFLVESYQHTQLFLHHVKNTANACLILDLNMPDLNGLQVQRQLKERGIDLPIVVYSGSADVSSAVQAMESGALTLLQKPSTPTVLVNTVVRAIEQHQVKQNRSDKKIQAEKQLAKLSKREKTIAIRVAQGLSAASIAQELFISSRTVEAHKSSIFSKLEMKSVAKLTLVVVNSGALDE